MRGLDALDRVLRPPPNCYVCPVCLDIFWLHELTREHAPPRSIDGRVLCLTCRTCNSSGGHHLETAVAAEKRLQGFQWRTPGTYDVKMATGSITLNVECNWAEGGTSIAIPGERNDPRQVDALLRLIPESRELTLTCAERYTQRQADVAYLRAAYLVAFAKLGYRFVFQPELNPVRALIQNPSETEIPICRTYIDDQKLFGRYLITMGDPVRCIVVVIDRSVVFLPLAREPMDRIQKWLEDGRRIGRPLSLKGRGPWSWPRGSEFDLDLHGRVLNRPVGG